MAGNILGVQDGFSLKNALVSGLTAGATAGLGSALGAAPGVTLSSGRTAALAAGSTIANAAANKLVGNPSGFRWANVAAAAVSSYIGSEVKLGGAPLSQGFAQDANIFGDAFGSIARAGISYGVTKGFFNEGSWNFVDVATDAFGNALGNSVVRQATSGPTAQEIAAAQSQADAIGQIGQNAVNPGTDATVAKIGQQTATNLSAQVDRVSWALNHNAMLEADAYFTGLEAVNFASGVNFAERGLANLTGMNNDLALKEASVDNIQSRVGLLAQNSANFRLSDVRRSSTPYQGISDQELQNFLGVDALADDLFGMTVNENFGLGTQLSNAEYQHLDSYFATKDLLGSISPYVTMMGTIDDVFKSSDLFIGSGFQLGYKDAAWGQFALDAVGQNGRTFSPFGLFDSPNPSWTLGSQFSQNFPEFGSLTDDFARSINFSTDRFISGLQTSGRLLERGALIGTPLVGLYSTVNEYQKYGEFNAEVGITGGKALFDTGLGIAAFLNPAVAIPASLYLASDAALGFMGTDWREVMDVSYQNSQQMVEMGVPYRDAFNVGPKF